MPIVASGVVLEPPLFGDTSVLRTRRTSRLRPLTTAVVGALATAIVVVLSVVTWTVVTAHPGAQTRTPTPSGTLSDADREALALPPSTSTMFDPGVASAVVAAFERSLASSVVTQVSLYPDSAVAVVPAGVGLRQHTWSAGRVGAGTPRAVTDDPTELVFDVAEVDWSAIAALAERAPVLAGVEGGIVTHVIIDRSTFDPHLPITIRVSVAGPNGSGFVEAAADGAVLAVH